MLIAKAKAHSERQIQYYQDAIDKATMAVDSFESAIEYIEEMTNKLGGGDNLELRAKITDLRDCMSIDVAHRKCKALATKGTKIELEKMCRKRKLDQLITENHEIKLESSKSTATDQQVETETADQTFKKQKC